MTPSQLVAAHSPRESWSDEAKRRGTEARLSGVPYVSNPYPYGGPLHDAWFKAWIREDVALRTPRTPDEDHFGD